MLMGKPDASSNMIAAVNRGDFRALLNGLVESLAEIGDIGRVAHEAVRAGMALGRAEATNEPIPPEALGFLHFMAAAPTAPAAFKALRQNLNVSQDKVATLAGVARQTVTDWENGTAPMPVCAIHALMQLGARKFAGLPDDEITISGADIRALRQALNMTRADMATALGVSVPGIEGWEYGTRRISPRALHRIRVPFEQLCARAAAG